MIVADVILWRRKNVTVWILLGAAASWVLFEVAGYSLVSLLSNVLLLLICILFFWAKAARILNRPAPPIPKMHLSEGMMHEAAVFVHVHANKILSAFNDIVQRKDSKVFYMVAFSLWLVSIIGGSIDIVTLGYLSLLLILTVPALYEKYEDGVDRYFKLAHMEVQLYERVYIVCFCKYFIKSQKWLSEVKKLLSDA
ncbi:hypothetical protein Cni_G23719 [Canna indica]|uniref:Reticulon-like protein n=1 Tax=Canna indica TaxID=4628 RepID=A0AAQ3QMI3_9LILI|nr:hypothetical protein Cni_G23719 [Canna indica]